MPHKLMNRGQSENSLSLPEHAPLCALPEFGGKRYQTGEVVIDLHPPGPEYYFILPLEAVTFSIGPPIKVASAFDSDSVMIECLMPNSMGFCEKGTQIYSVALEQKPVKRTLAFSYPPEWRQRIAEDVRGYHSSSLRTIHNLAPTPTSSALMQQTAEFLNGDFWGGKLVAESLAVLSIVQVLEALNKSAPASIPPKLSNRASANTLEFIEENLDRNIGLKDLAQVANISLYHFARCFKNTTGFTPNTYVTKRRVVRAKAMLESGDVSLINIASACGFSSQSHLTKIFKRHTGMTPLHYRKAAQKA